LILRYVAVESGVFVDRVSGHERLLFKSAHEGNTLSTLSATYNFGSQVPLQPLSVIRKHGHIINNSAEPGYGRAASWKSGSLNKVL
jgi:hypothetical protein